MPHASDVEAGSLQYEPHELDAAPSPLLRFLPVYERDFRGHLLRARSLSEASQTRLRDAEQLLSEMVRSCYISAVSNKAEGRCKYPEPIRLADIRAFCIAR